MSHHTRPLLDTFKKICQKFPSHYLTAYLVSFIYKIYQWEHVLYMRFVCLYEVFFQASIGFSEIFLFVTFFKLLFQAQGYMCRFVTQVNNEIAGSIGISISRSLMNRHTVFHNGGTNLHSHQQCKSVPISPHPLQHLLSPDFLMIAIITGMRWYHNVVLICISLMTSDENFFICLLASCISSFVKCLFISLTHF